MTIAVDLDTGEPMVTPPLPDMHTAWEFTVTLDGKEITCVEASEEGRYVRCLQRVGKNTFRTDKYGKPVLDLRYGDVKITATKVE